MVLPNTELKINFYSGTVERFISILLLTIYSLCLVILETSRSHGTAAATRLSCSAPCVSIFEPVFWVRIKKIKKTNYLK